MLTIIPLPLILRVMMTWSGGGAGVAWLAGWVGKADQ